MCASLPTAGGRPEEIFPIRGVRAWMCGSWFVEAMSLPYRVVRVRVLHADGASDSRNALTPAFNIRDYLAPIFINSLIWALEAGPLNWPRVNKMLKLAASCGIKIHKNARRFILDQDSVKQFMSQVKSSYKQGGRHGLQKNRG